MSAVVTNYFLALASIFLSSSRVIAHMTTNDEQVLSVHHTSLLCSENDICPPGFSTIGAEIRGITNFSTLSESQIVQIREALVDYKVLYFKDVADFTSPSQQLAFAEKFGTVYPEISTVPAYVKKGVHQSVHSARSRKHTVANATEEMQSAVSSMVTANEDHRRYFEGKKLPDKVARLVREPEDPYAFGEGWHADVTFFAQPPFFTFLMGREMPGRLDDTIFIDVQRAYDDLPEPIKEEITGLSAYHNDSAGIFDVHPMVRTHPESGRHGLYVNSHFTHRIVGYSQEESTRLLNSIFDHIEAQPVFRFKWTGRHALLWDNRGLQHTATTEWAFDTEMGQKRRELHRVVISGDDRPYFRWNQKTSMRSSTTTVDPRTQKTMVCEASSQQSCSF
eukprot:g3533.t1